MTSSIEAGDGPATHTYRGNCHCGSYIFEVTVPELKKITVCNCSICIKNNYMYMWLKRPRDTFKVIKDEGLLTEYKFAAGGVFGIGHKFCSKCGVSVIGCTKDDMVLNARTLQNVNHWALDAAPFDGANLGPKYVAPKHTGPEPAHVFEDETQEKNAKIYHGSCHCGAVTAAVKLPGPLDDKGGFKGGDIVECDCSICMRAGFTWIYPLSTQVSVSDPSSSLTTYAFNRGIFNKTFCKKCGVYLTNDVDLAKTEEEMKEWPEATRNFRENFKQYRPFNIRTLNDFDFAGLDKKDGKDGKSRIKKLEGKNTPPVYAEP